MRYDLGKKAVGAGALAAVALGGCKGKEPPFEPEFECGELDFTDGYVLLVERRVVEVACGEMPEGTDDRDVPWREVAARYRRHPPCFGASGGSPEWTYHRAHPCALEAAVNASVHGFRVAGCPEWEYEAFQNPTDNFFVGWTPLAHEVYLTLESTCSDSAG
jgi:hypothetical protein